MYGEAVQEFLELKVKPVYRLMKAQDYRDKIYWNEYTDNLFIFHSRLFEEIYQTYSGSQVRPGEENFMHVSEFEKIFIDAKLQNPRFTNKDINFWYMQSIQAQIDETKSWRHLQMSYIEFLEAIARMADILSYPPPTDKFKNEYLKQVEGDDDSINLQVIQRRK